MADDRVTETVCEFQGTENSESTRTHICKHTHAQYHADSSPGCKKKKNTQKFKKSSAQAKPFIGRKRQFS